MALPAVVTLVGMLSSVSFVGWLARALLVGAGFAVFEVVGLSGFLDGVDGLIRSSITGLPGDVVAYMGLANIDLFINWVMMAMAARVSMQLLTRLLPGR
jgi:hypothetical protein